MQLNSLRSLMSRNYAWLGKSLRGWLGLGLMLASTGVGAIAKADEAPPWLFRGKRGGSREDLGSSQVCAISPEPGAHLLSNRPRFIWQGSVGRIEVLSEDEAEILWSHTPRTGDGKPYGIAVPEMSLQPGQWYVLYIFDRSGQLAHFAGFDISTQQPIANAKTRDSIAAEGLLAYAQELSEQGHWSDAMGILFSRSEAEGLAAEYRKEVVNHYCF